MENITIEEQVNEEVAALVAAITPDENISTDAEVSAVVAEQAEEVVAEQADEVVAEQAEEVVAEQADEVVAEQAGEVVAEQAEEVVAEQAEVVAEQAEVVAEQADEVVAEQAEEVEKFKPVSELIRQFDPSTPEEVKLLPVEIVDPTEAVAEHIEFPIQSSIDVVVAPDFSALKTALTSDDSTALLQFVREEGLLVNLANFLVEAVKALRSEVASQVADDASPSAEEVIEVTNAAAELEENDSVGVPMLALQRSITTSAVNLSELANAEDEAAANDAVVESGRISPSLQG